MEEVPLVPPILPPVLNSMMQLGVAVALVPGQSALGYVQEAWVPPEPDVELHLPGEVPTAVPLWQHGLQQKQVQDWVCTWHSIPRLSQEHKLGRVQLQAQLTQVWLLVPSLPGCLHQMLSLPLPSVAQVAAQSVVAVDQT